MFRQNDIWRRREGRICTSYGGIWEARIKTGDFQGLHNYGDGIGHIYIYDASTGQVIDGYPVAVCTTTGYKGKYNLGYPDSGIECLVIDCIADKVKRCLPKILKVGRIALFTKYLYNEATYRPGKSNALKMAEHFYSIANAVEATREPIRQGNLNAKRTAPDSIGEETCNKRNRLE